MTTTAPHLHRPARKKSALQPIPPADERFGGSTRVSGPSLVLTPAEQKARRAKVQALIQGKPASKAREYVPQGYAGTELKPNPGIPEGRMAAYRLPSRVGKRLHWPDGRVTDLNGLPWAGSAKE